MGLEWTKLASRTSVRGPASGERPTITASDANNGLYDEAMGTYERIKNSKNDLDRIYLQKPQIYGNKNIGI